MFGISGIARTVVSASVVLASVATPAFAQARGQAPATPPARGQAPPAAPASAPAPAAAQPAPAPQPPTPFPAGAKIGYVNLQQLAQESADGKASAAKVQKTAADKQTEAGNRAKSLAAKQQQLQAGGSVMSDAARDQLTKDIASLQRDNERFEQDAQAELNELQQSLQNDLFKKLIPVLEDIRKDKDLWMILSAADAGMLVANPGLDFTEEAVKRMDAKK